MSWNGRKPPCYEYRPDRNTYVFHISEEESVEVSALPFTFLPEDAGSPRAPLVRLLTGVSCLEMLRNPLRWARYFGTKSAEDYRSEDQ